MNTYKDTLMLNPIINGKVTVWAQNTEWHYSILLGCKTLVTMKYKIQAKGRP